MCVGLLRDRYEAEDAAQQAFLSAYRALVDGTEPRDEAAWLATIARNECLLRIRARMRAPVAAPAENEPGPSDVHREAVSRSHAARLWREIGDLPQQQRDAVILREFAGLSYEELAVALGISKPAVESLLFRARGRLRQRLEAAFASLNLAGAASTIAEAAARLLGSGGAPQAAAKIATAGVAAALVGGGTAVVAEHASPPAHHRAAAPRRDALRLPRIAAQPQTLRFVMTTTPATQPTPRPAAGGREHERDGGDAAAFPRQGGDGQGDRSDDSSGAHWPWSPPRAEADDGEAQVAPAPAASVPVAPAPAASVTVAPAPSGASTPTTTTSDSVTPWGGGDRSEDGSDG